MNNSEGAGQADGSGHGLTRFGGEQPSKDRPVEAREGSAAFNFATRNGSPVFLKLGEIAGVQEVTIHDSNGKKGVNIILSSGKEVETVTPLVEVLKALGW